MHEGPFSTPDAIRACCDHFIKNGPPGLIGNFRIIRQDVHGEVIYIVWTAEPCVHWATDTFVVRNGTIVLQTYGACMPVGNVLAGVAGELGLEES